MRRSLLAVVLALVAAPSSTAVAADPVYYLDVSVRRAVVVETRCPDGSRTLQEITTIWEASGSGRLFTGDGNVEITVERWRFTERRPRGGGGGPEHDRERKRLSARDAALRTVVHPASGRIAVELGAFSPLKRTVRVGAPAAHGRARVRLADRELRNKGRPDAMGCVPTTIRATSAAGSLQRFA